MSTSNRWGIALCIALAFTAICVMWSNARGQALFVCMGPMDASCPPECRRDLSHIYTDGDVVLDYVDLDVSQSQYIKTGERGYGLWIPYTQPKRTIIINSRLRGQIREAAKHHEACHEERFRLYGDPRYHQ